MDKIELEAKNDHELLVMLVMQGNQVVEHIGDIDTSIRDHETRIRKVESRPNCENTKDWRTKLKEQWPFIATFASVIALGIVELSKLL